MYSSKLHAEITLYDSSYLPVIAPLSTDVPAKPTYSPRKDFFLVGNIQLPTLAPGTYNISVQVEDELTNSRSRKEDFEFQVGSSLKGGTLKVEADKEGNEIFRSNSTQVKAGQTVRVESKVGSVTVCRDGVAMGGGELGDVIRVRTVNNEAIIDGTISGPGEVTISRPEKKVFLGRDLVEIVLPEESKDKTKNKTDIWSALSPGGALLEWFLSPSGRMRNDGSSARIRAEVIGLKPNGYLLLESKHHVVTDELEMIVTLTGICRSKDIVNNSVHLKQMSELELQKHYKQVVREDEKRGHKPKQEAAVVINQASKVISWTGNVEIAPVGVVVAGTEIQIGKAQAYQGQAGGARLNRGAVKLEELMAALNQLNVSAEDQIILMRNLDAQGCIGATVEWVK
ncbi:MAG: hypothetical protein GY869_21295 [Planctomycetes bacterium]|nr:hypothetical protein [Planctomycetota bacterium]